MKKVSLLLVAAMFLSTVAIYANAPKKSEPTKSLSAQIGNLLEDNQFTADDKNLTASILFTVNKNNEIVVISVDTNNAGLESFVKGRLNYQKVEVTQNREGKMYTVPVRIAI